VSQKAKEIWKGVFYHCVSFNEIECTRCGRKFLPFLKLKRCSECTKYRSHGDRLDGNYSFQIKVDDIPKICRLSHGPLNIAVSEYIEQMDVPVIENYEISLYVGDPAIKPEDIREFLRNCEKRDYIKPRKPLKIYRKVMVNKIEYKIYKQLQEISYPAYLLEEWWNDKLKY
jgi:ribosomal protein L37E